MKKALLLLLVATVLCNSAYSQIFSIFDLDATNFPTIKAKFIVTKQNGDQITNLSPEDFEIIENGVERNVTKVSCPSSAPPVPLSSVLTIDVSGSMSGKNLEYAKDAAKAWVNELSLGSSDCAITTFDTKNYFNQDFTVEKHKLLRAINNISAKGGTNFDAGFISPMAGALLAAKDGKHKRVVVFLTDGQAEGNKEKIINKAKEIRATVYCVVINESCPKILQDIANETGGKWYEKITSSEQAVKIYKEILQTARIGNPCNIEWTSQIDCEAFKNADITCLPIAKSAVVKYRVEKDQIASLEVNPLSVRFGGVKPGNSKDTNVTVTAYNSDFSISNIIDENEEFEIEPKSFELRKGKSQDLTITFTPQDSGYSFSRFSLEGSPCGSYLYVTGGFPDVPPDKKTLTVTHPNGGEQFLAGADTVITWEGISPDETVSLEYSVDEGNSWKKISDAATGNKFQWKNLPDTTSDKCLVKAEVNDILLWSTESIKSQSLDWNSDGTMIAYPGGNNIKIIDAQSGETIHIFSGLDVNGDNLAWSSDDEKIAFSGSNGAYIINAFTGKVIETLEKTSSIKGLVWSPDNSKLAAVQKYSVLIWDAKTGDLLNRLTPETGIGLLGVEWSPDGSKIASCSWAISFKIWDVESGEQISTIEKHSGSVFSLSWSPDGSKIASGSRDESIKIWNADTGEEINQFTGHAGYVYSVDWSPDGSKIVSASQDKTVKIWNVNTGEEIKHLEGHNYEVKTTLWSPDGSKIVSGSTAGSIFVWKAETGEIITSKIGHSGAVRDVDWSPDGSKLATASSDYSVKIWNAKTGEYLNTVLGKRVAWSPDGSKLATLVHDIYIYLWDAETGDQLDILEGHTNNIRDFAWNPGGSKIASGAKYGRIKIWDINTSEEILTIYESLTDVNSVAWSPDGSKILSCNAIAFNFRGEIIIWDANSGDRISTLSEESAYIEDADWSPDGSKIASTSTFYKKIKIFDADTGDELRTLSDLSVFIHTVDWNPDGYRLATGSSDNTIRIWDVDSGEEIESIKMHSSDVSSVAWGAAGLKIASGSTDQTAKIFDLGVEPLQKDFSDSVWSLATPKAEALDVDMGKVVVGESKDSVVKAFLKNTGAYPCKINSIRFRGNYYNQFDIISGVPPFTIPAGEEKPVEFHFEPTIAQEITASLDIETQVKTLRHTIKGEGVHPELEVFSDIIDFGKVRLSCDSVISKVVLTNIATETINIDSTVMLGPDKTQFEIISGGGDFTLATQESREITVRFAPQYTGRTSGQIGFYYDHFASPAKTLLFGEGISDCDETGFYYSNFDNAVDLNVIEYAEEQGNSMVLTPAAAWQKGAVWRSNRMPVKKGFTTEFSFRLSEGNQDASPTKEKYAGADGVAFVVQNQSPAAIGRSGKGVGYSGIKNCCVVEFDAYDNNVEGQFSDPGEVHAGVFYSDSSKVVSSEHGSQTHAESTSDIMPIIPDGRTYYAKIDYNLDSLKNLVIYLDTTQEFKSPPVLIIENFEGLDNIGLEKEEFAWVGFTSATGAAYEKHELLDWYFCPKPTDAVLDVDWLKQAQGDFEAYPNPTSDKLNIMYSLEKTSYVEIRIVDLIGRTEKLINRELSIRGEHKIEANVNDLKPGIYNIVLQTDNYVKTRRVIIVR